MAVYGIEELERLLGTKLGTEDRAALVEIEREAQAEVEEYTNRTLDTPAELTEIRSGDGTRILKLYNDAEKANVTSVEYRVGSTWTTVDSDSYDIFNDNELHSFGIRWPYGDMNMRIVYTPSALHKDLRQTVARIVLGKWRSHRAGEPFVMPGDVQAALDRWRVRDFEPQPRLVGA